MAIPKLVLPEPISLRDHPEFSEKWLEDQIVENPSILNLGEVEVRGRQRMQPRAGRLDLLLEDLENRKRYEVELQLGKTDESHIIRTIEYWDIERKRYPQYDHCAVLVAEDMTSRFLNVIGLFNGFIPIIAIQMQALKVNEGIALVFTKVLDELQLGIDDTATSEKIVRTRSDWEQRVPKNILQLVDELFENIKKLDPSYELNYRKYFIGLARSGIANNFVHFKPKQKFLKITFKCEQSDELEKQLEIAGIELLGYEKKWHEYTIRLTPSDYISSKDLLANVIKVAYEYNTRD
jgi:predicted transport protein